MYYIILYYSTVIYACIYIRGPPPFSFYCLRFSSFIVITFFCSICYFRFLFIYYVFIVCLNYTNGTSL